MNLLSLINITMIIEITLASKEAISPIIHSLVLL